MPIVILCDTREFLLSIRPIICPKYYHIKKKFFFIIYLCGASSIESICPIKYMKRIQDI